ncbi:MAG: hypothetical protein F6J97_01425 [Leptolyngbya sp. SIO4C1]|nr:hypothetical protein [Leptolyngbya sp. SIO4C1]
MTLNEFELRYRESIREALDQLQYMTLLSAQMRDTVALVGDSLQSLNQTTEQFIDEQRRSTEAADEPPAD